MLKTVDFGDASDARIGPFRRREIRNFRPQLLRSGVAPDFRTRRSYSMDLEGHPGHDQHGLGHWAEYTEQTRLLDLQAKGAETLVGTRLCRNATK